MPHIPSKHPKPKQPGDEDKVDEGESYNTMNDTLSVISDANDAGESEINNSTAAQDSTDVDADLTPQNLTGGRFHSELEETEPQVDRPPRDRERDRVQN